MTSAQRDRVRRWVAALRSGEFKQGREVLRRGDEFCCLGVACELYRREVGGAWEDYPRPPQGQWFKIGSSTYVDAFLPRKVRDWLGLPSVDPIACGRTPLALMNDEGQSFGTIADAIEATYLADDGDDTAGD